MNKQKSLLSPEDELSQIRTKEKEFLEQIERMGSNDKAVLLQMRAREYTIRPEINRTAYFARMSFLDVTFRQANFLWKNSLRCGIIHL